MKDEKKKSLRLYNSKKCFPYFLFSYSLGSSSILLKCLCDSSCLAAQRRCHIKYFWVSLINFVCSSKQFKQISSNNSKILVAYFVVGFFGIKLRGGRCVLDWHELKTSFIFFSSEYKDWSGENAHFNLKCLALRYLEESGNEKLCFTEKKILFWKSSSLNKPMVCLSTLETWTQFLFLSIWFWTYRSHKGFSNIMLQDILQHKRQRGIFLVSLRAIPVCIVFLTV